MNDEVTLTMHEVQTKLADQAINEINKLRREITAFKLEREAVPGVLWELQERIQMLEAALAAQGQPKETE